MDVKHIVFPFDYSNAAMRTAPSVEAAAREFGAHVSLLHVEGLIAAYSDDLLHFITDSEMKLLLNRQKEMLRLLSQHCFSQDFLERAGSHDYVAIEGDPADTIVRFAREHNADLIMMPTHGLGSFRRLLLGSTTAKVLHDAPMPVWTSVHGEHTDLKHAGNSPFCERIICGIDLGPSSIRILKAAESLARTSRARWCVIHAIESDGSREAEAREKARRLLEAAGFAAPLCIGTASAASAIRDHALETSADLVVIGRGCLTERLGRLRTNVYAIIRESPCAVLSI